MESHDEIPTLTDVIEIQEGKLNDFVERAFTAEQIAAFEIPIPEKAMAQIKQPMLDIRSVGDVAESPSKEARVTANADSLGTVLGADHELGRAIEEIDQTNPGEDSSIDFWDKHPRLGATMLAGVAALSLLSAKPAEARDNHFRDQVRAELQLQAGTAVNNAVGQVLQIGVGVLAQRVGVPTPQPAYGGQPGVVIGIGGLPPPGVIIQQPGQQYEFAQKIQNLENSFRNNKSLSEQYYAEVKGYSDAYNSYLAAGRTDLAQGQLQLYNMNLPKYQAQLAKTQSAFEALNAARAGR